MRDRADGGSGGGAGGGRGGGSGGGADDTASADDRGPEADAQQKPPPPALPGRGPRRPLTSPEDAAARAGRLLERARGSLRQGDRVAAADLAIEAYDLVLPHAATDEACGKLCGQLDRLLESADGRGGAGAVPTRFE